MRTPARSNARDKERNASNLKYSMLDDDWIIGDDGSFESVLSDSSPEQRLFFSPRFKNGSISADITPLEAAPRRGGEARLEAALICRSSGSDGFYYAGMGAWDTKFFIGRMNAGPFYQLREYVGRGASVAPKKTYRLRLDFNGSQLTLFENDVQQLQLRDEGLQIGQCGLRTWMTRARFTNVQVKRAKPRAFVVMPFTSELDFVHGVVRSTVESYGCDVVRADEVFLSRPVMDDVKTMIAEADLVIVDFTGKNPNVYYEAGLADAWKKDWIVLVQSTDDLTFDVRHIRSIRYSNTMGADRKLEANLRSAMEALGYGSQDASVAASAPKAAAPGAKRAAPGPPRPRRGAYKRGQKPGGRGSASAAS
jgi:hypothetical protein